MLPGDVLPQPLTEPLQGAIQFMMKFDLTVTAVNLLAS
ncbi:hypothetical protein ACCUM_2621 [Candidatus Accumulibacter phosphatis]|uniref:Uncharacterized protein n=1 Tax=Candidatus Accumulibacter phosphatis TaxID=327160 RepID=A0A5S4FAQ0_9PROT|nr:hypothetical protein ACCUM_2621 [Candidatus Accumulibacter phosphatis]